VSEEVFQQKAAEAKQKCPVSKVLSGAEIKLSARLVK
jgi:organic hydroperoxide reductase OsmC/OhrA